MIPSWIVHKISNLFHQFARTQGQHLGLCAPGFSSVLQGLVQLLAQPEVQDTGEDLLNHWKIIRILSCVRTGEGRQ